MTSDLTQWPHGALASLRPGSRVGGYLIERQIGAGGMALVFRARDELLGRQAAVKVIAPSMADNAEFRARFLRESRAAAAVDSPNILPVYRAGEAEGLLYIAMRFVAGGDLAGLMRRSGGRLSPGRAASLVSQVASALDAAHAAGLVHRDVKPQNVLVDTDPDESEHAYLSDFGLSKRTQSTALTASGQFLGTPDYAAPEQISSDYVDGQTDQYALGCVTFELLTGALPFHRQEPVGTLFAHLRDPVPSLTMLRAELPAAIDGVVARALAKSPDGRYHRCEEFAAALQEALGLARRVAPSASWARPARHVPVVVSVQPPPEQPPPAFPRVPAAPRADRLQLAPMTGRGSTQQALTHDRAAAVPGRAVPSGTIVGGNGGGRHGRDTPRRGRGRDGGRALALWALGAATVLVADLVAVLGFHVLSPEPGPPSPASSHPGTGEAITPRVLSSGHYGFNYPQGMTDDGTHVWVTNADSVTELSATDGSLIRVLSGGKYGFFGPQGIADDGTHVWVTNTQGGSVTELSATDGSLIRTLSGGKYGFRLPMGIADDGIHVWVADSGTDSVTELSATDGSLIRSLSGGKYGFSDPGAVAVDSNHVWVLTSNNSVTELNTSNGLVRVLSGGTYAFKDSRAIIDDGTHVWVANRGADSVTELNVSDGSWVQTLSSIRFQNPMGIATDGTHIWVTNDTGDSVTELSASDGTWIRTLSGDKYGFAHPDSVVAKGTHVWVASIGAAGTGDGASVTELTMG